MAFINFCKTVSSDVNVKISDDMSLDNIPKKYINDINDLKSSFEFKENIIPNMDIPYVEKSFNVKHKSLSDAINDICIREFGQSSIPDTLFNNLSCAIYNKTFNGLSNDNKIIIKTLVMYILLSNK